MNNDIIVCPECQTPLALPDDLFGQRVECPQCRARFTAPRPTTPPPADRPPPGRDYNAFRPPEPIEPIETEDAAYHRARAALRTPAILIIVFSALAALQGLLGFVFAEQNVRNLHDLGQDPDLPPAMRNLFGEIADKANPQTIRTTNIIHTLLALATLIGAMQMLRVQNYSMAVIAAALALNPLNCPCCLITAPIGLWAMLLLFNAEIRRGFE